MTPINLIRSSAFRLAFLYMTLFGMSVLLLLGYIYWTTTGFMENQVEETINAEILGLSERYELLGIAGLIHIVNERTTKDTTRTSIYLVTDKEFNPLAGNLEQWPHVTEDLNGWMKFIMNPSPQALPEMALARHIPLKGDFHLLVGRDESDRRKLEQMIIKSLGSGMALTLVLGLLGGLLMSRGMLRRLDVISRGSREIMRGDLSRRIPLKGTNDEFDRLIGSLNDMLDRIEALMAGLRQVSDNIAHDLRSPLNRLRTRLEVVLLEQPDAEGYRTVIEKSIASVDELLQTFNALLKIAQAEAGLKREDITQLDLAALVSDVAELYEPLAEEKGQHFKTLFSGRAYISGNRHLLSQAIANMVDNAIKYTPQGGEVALQLTRTKEGATLVISDNGPGVPFEERATVLQRFYRLETSRNAPGSGLGLSLVAAVVKMHSAMLTLEDNHPGLRVVIHFPSALLTPGVGRSPSLGGASDR